MSTTISKSGIKTSTDGNSYIPSSKRADGSTRKEIKVRPGYRPPEDVETYKNRGAEAWKTRGSGGVPGAEGPEDSQSTSDSRSKNAKRREAAKRKLEAEALAATAANINTIDDDQQLGTKLQTVHISQADTANENGTPASMESKADVEQQKKIRNLLKKLRAVKELKEKKAGGEKLSHDQLLKIGKEDELLRDLKKLNYDGPELPQT